jgi:hypothetical protein
VREEEEEEQEKEEEEDVTDISGNDCSLSDLILSSALTISKTLE